MTIQCQHHWCCLATLEYQQGKPSSNIAKSPPVPQLENTWSNHGCNRLGSSTICQEDLPFMCFQVLLLCWLKQSQANTVSVILQASFFGQQCYWPPLGSLKHSPWKYTIFRKESRKGKVVFHPHFSGATWNFGGVSLEPSPSGVGFQSWRQCARYACATWARRHLVPLWKGIYARSGRLSVSRNRCCFSTHLVLQIACMHILKKSLNHTYCQHIICIWIINLEGFI